MKLQLTKLNLINLSVTIFFIAFLATFFHLTLSYRIDIFEFDSRVTLTLIESLITVGKITIPFVDDGTFSFCNSLNICSNTQDLSNGQNTMGQLSANLTSGLIMLYPSKILHNFLSIFDLNGKSISYMLFLYSVSTGLLVSLILFFINTFSNFNILKKISVWTIPIPIICSIFLISGDRIVGEFISTILICISIFALILSHQIKQKPIFYILIAFVIGMSFEVKSTVGLVSFITFLFLCYQSWVLERSLKNIFVYIFFAALPKILFFIYVFNVVNFSLDGFINYLQVYSAVASHNAKAFLNWEVPNLFSGVMFFGNDILYKKILLVLLALLIFFYLITCIFKKNYKKIILPMFTLMIIFSSLIYPVIFSTPYPRIFSFFWGVSITCFLGLTMSLNIFFKSLKNEKVFQSSFIILSIIIFLISSPFSKVASNSKIQNWLIFESGQEVYADNEFEKLYPKIDVSNDTKFLIDGFNVFFVMPWDYYLGRRLQDDNVPLFFSSKSINPKNDFKTDTFVLTTCRWGHCSMKNVLDLIINSGNNIVELTCTYVEPSLKNKYFLRLYDCN